MAAAITRQLHDRYLIGDEIASGGMAAVHLGLLLGPVGFTRAVAIKRLHAHYAHDPEYAAMLLDEARLAARIRHPNVVGTLDVAMVGEDLFLVMEYVHGQSLSRLMRDARRRGESVPLDVALGIIIGALGGLHAAHEVRDESGRLLSLVHRDVSPQNLVIGTDGLTRVADFGIAKAEGRLQSTREGQVKGKLAYMAPEQYERQEPDRRVDVYSSAVVLWECLTGTSLFGGGTPGEIMRDVMHAEIARPSRHNPDLPAELDEILMRGLSRDPARRFSSARDMALALEALGRAASLRQVGEWVESLAAEALSSRAEILSRLETEAGRLGGVVRASAAAAAPGAAAEVTQTDAGTLDAAVPTLLSGTFTRPVDTAPSAPGSSLADGVGRRPSARVLFAIAAAAVVIIVSLSAVILTRLRATPVAQTVTAPPSTSVAAAAPRSVEPALASAAPSVASAAPQPAPPQPRKARTPSVPAPRKPPPDCANPFRVDAQGVKRPKPECFKR